MLALYLHLIQILIQTGDSYSEHNACRDCKIPHAETCDNAAAVYLLFFSVFSSEAMKADTVHNFMGDKCF